jgi:hypothetical protein
MASSRKKEKERERERERERELIYYKQKRIQLCLTPGVAP